jgi:hypothetical protein
MSFSYGISYYKPGGKATIFLVFVSFDNNYFGFSLIFPSILVQNGANCVKGAIIKKYTF